MKYSNNSEFYSPGIKLKRREVFLKFLFPLYPYHVFKTTKFLITIAALLALRILFTFFNVPIVATNQVISFDWIPVMIMGWIFGPIHGLFFGMFTDTLCYFIRPSGQWFWMYAIQECIVGFISGLTHSIYEIRVAGRKKIIFDFLITQIILFSFVIVCLTGILLWTNNNVIDYYNSYKYVCVALTIVYFIAINCFMLIYLKNIKENKNRFLLFLYALTLISVIAIFFSLLLGPIASVEYLRYINNGADPEAYAKYGLLFYFIPRVIVQTIKVPFETIIFCSTLLVINPILKNYINELENSWK